MNGKFVMRGFFLLPVLFACLLPGALAATGETAAFTFVRLTPSQYQHSIHDIFGKSIRIDGGGSSLGVREDGLMAIGARKLTVSAAELESYEAFAKQVAAQVTDPRRRATLIHCKPASDTAPDDDCATQFVATVGLHLFRRPLSDNETGAYVTMASSATQSLDDFYAGLRAAMIGMLVSPDFLFRIEQSDADPDQPDRVRLDAWSSASRLSFFLWDTTPDPELLDAARSGELLTEEGLKRQVERLMASPRIESGLRAFFSDMLGFDKFATLDIDSSLYPKFTKNVEDDAREQTLRTIIHQLLTRNADYREIFTTRETFLTPGLAALYGVPIPIRQEMGGAVPWQPYRFAESDPYIGILGQVSFLSLNSHPARTSPTLRGKALRESLLCQKVPAPPGDVDFSLVQDTSNPKYKTTRQRLTAHSRDRICAGCHKITDRSGLSLEKFDTAAAFRTTENGAPIDASGNFNGQDYDGLKGLAEMVANSSAATSCLIRRAYSYGTARKPAPDERQWLQELQSRLEEDGVRWRELMQRITMNPDFFTVVVPDDGSLSAR